MNLTTLTTLAAQFAGDPVQSRYSGLYTQALNLAQQQFAIDSKCLWKDWPTTTIVSGTANYTLPSDFMWEKEVMINGLKIFPVSRATLDRDYANGARWDQMTGTPRNYIIDPEVGKNQILLFPIPQGNDNGNSFVLTYYVLPTDLASASDIPFNSTTLLVQFHMGLAAWAAWFLLNGETAVTDGIMAKKKEMMTIYNDCVAQAINTFKNTVSEPLRQRSSRTYARSPYG